MNEQTEKIIAEIQKEKIVMKPKIYFLLQGFMVFFGLVISFLATIYVVSLFVFFFKLRGAYNFPGFNLLAMKDLLLSLPIVIMLVATGLIVVLYWFSRRFAFTYRRPVILSLMGVILLVILGGFLVAASPVHYNMYKKFGKNLNGSVFFRTLYAPENHPPLKNSLIGEIVVATQREMKIITHTRSVCPIVLLKPSAKSSRNSFVTGDWVFVYGRPEDASFYATKVVELDSQEYALDSLVPESVTLEEYALTLPISCLP